MTTIQPCNIGIPDDAQIVAALRDFLRHVQYGRFTIIVHAGAIKRTEETCQRSWPPHATEPKPASG